MGDVLESYLGKEVVVTGSSSGIGESVAWQLLAAGADVIGIDRTPPSYSLKNFVRTDLGDFESIKSAVAQLPAEVWSLFNCAGVSSGAADQETVLRVNFIGFREFLERAAERMPPGTAIVSTASTGSRDWVTNFGQIRGLVETDGFAEAQEWVRAHEAYVAERDAYRLSKECMAAHAVIRCFDLAERGVRINVVAPGVTDTPILRAAAKWSGEGILKPPRPFGRLATADEQAKIHLFLNSDWASYVNGQLIWGDGGRMVRRVLGEPE